MSDESYPTAKSITCMFCLSTVRLVRRGTIGPLSGRPMYFYIEQGRANDGLDHMCHRKVALGKVQPETVEHVDPAYGPHFVDFSIPYEGPRLHRTDR